MAGFITLPESMRAADFCRLIPHSKLHGSPAAEICSMTIDSRQVKERSLFIATKGARVDGHAFIDDSLKKGAQVCMGRGPVDPEWLEGERAFIEVSDGVKALQQAARARAARLNGNIVAITGSNGKTSVKELIAHLAAGYGTVACSPENMNGQIGLPLSLFSFTDDVELYVIELGISQPDEMSRLLSIITPNIGVLLNVGPVHLEFFNSEMQIAQEKVQLFEKLPPKGIGVFNGDDPLIREAIESVTLPDTLLRFGYADTNQIRARNVTLSRTGCGHFELVVELNEHIETMVIEAYSQGPHAVINTLAAIAVMIGLGISKESFIHRISTFRPPEQRMEFKVSDSGFTVIDDSYNASPLSMEVALKTLHSMEGTGRKFVLLGEMLELGSRAVAFHEQVGAMLATMEMDMLFVYGRGGKWIANGAVRAGYPASQVVHSEDKLELVRLIRERITSHDVVLVKASRSIALDECIPLLLENRISKAGVGTTPGQ